VRDLWLRLGGWVVRVVELLCALVLLVSAWMLGELSDMPAAQEGEGTFGIAFLLIGFLVTVGLVAVLAGHAVGWLVRAPSGGRLAAVADALPRLAAEAGVAAVAVLVWPLAWLPFDYGPVVAVTVLAVAVTMHVAVDVARAARSLVG